MWKFSCAPVHFQEQFISFTVFGQRAGIYIKNRQTGRQKIDGILFSVRGEREREREGGVRGLHVQDGDSEKYSTSSVSHSLKNTLSAEVII